MSTQTKLLKVFETYDDEVVEKAFKAFSKQSKKNNGSKNGNGSTRSNGNGHAVMLDTTQDSNEGAWLKLAVEDVDDPGQPLHDGEDGCVSMESMPAIERIIAESNLLPVHFLEEGAKVQRAVGRVTLKVPHARLPAGSGWGTGFMLSPTLLMTNNHVIPTKAFSRKVEIQFNHQLDYQGMPQTVDTYQFLANDFFYTNRALDFTLIRVKTKCRFPVATDGRLVEMGSLPIQPPVITPPILPTLPPLFPPFVCQAAGNVWGFLQLPSVTNYSVGQSVNVVQHPAGRRKEVSLHDNELQHVFARHIRYTSDTEPGSSGSPVFNNMWDLIALHHAGGERNGSTWINNQGVRIDKIVQDIEDNVDRDTLTELGL